MILNPGMEGLRKTRNRRKTAVKGGHSKGEWSLRRFGLSFRAFRVFRRPSSAFRMIHRSPPVALNPLTISRSMKAGDCFHSEPFFCLHAPASQCH